MDAAQRLQSYYVQESKREKEAQAVKSYSDYFKRRKEDWVKEKEELDDERVIRDDTKIIESQKKLLRRKNALIDFQNDLEAASERERKLVKTALDLKGARPRVREKSVNGQLSFAGHRQSKFKVKEYHNLVAKVNSQRKALAKGKPEKRKPGYYSKEAILERKIAFLERTCSDSKMEKARKYIKKCSKTNLWNLRDDIMYDTLLQSTTFQERQRKYDLANFNKNPFVTGKKLSRQEVKDRAEDTAKRIPKYRHQRN